MKAKIYIGQVCDEFNKCEDCPLYDEWEGCLL